MKPPLAAIAALAVLFATAGAADADIAIAAAGPMSGQFDDFGAQMAAGAEQAVADINAAGGVLGQPLVLEIADDGCDPQQANAVANQLVGRRVALVVGHLCSNAAIPASAIYDDAGIIQISPGATSPAFTEQRPGPGIFRMCCRSDLQGRIAGAFIAATYADRNVAILDDRSSYGATLADEVRIAMNAAGKTETLSDSFVANEDDYSDLVARLKVADIGALFVGGYHGDAALIKRQMAEADMDTVLVAGDALVNADFWDIAGEAGAGTIMTFPPDPRKNPAAGPAIAAIEAAGENADMFALYAYAAVEAWAAAAEAAGTTDFDAVVAELSRAEFETALGPFRFDGKGDATLPAFVLYEWKDGVYDYRQ